MGRLTLSKVLGSKFRPLRPGHFGLEEDAICADSWPNRYVTVAKSVRWWASGEGCDARIFPPLLIPSDLQPH